MSLDHLHMLKGQFEEGLNRHLTQKELDFISWMAEQMLETIETK